MDHPYKSAADRNFWKRAFISGWESTLDDAAPLIRRGERVVSAGSCFAANIVPYLEAAGIEYVRSDQPPAVFADVLDDHFNYARFSAAYGNIYTPRQALQMLKRALGRFKPVEDRWIERADRIVDPFRPGLKYPATSEREFDLLTTQHLAAVLAAVRAADVFVFTLGLTEAWMSSQDGAVFPACPGTVAGRFDPARHVFKNFSAAEIMWDLNELINVLGEVRPGIRVLLTVSPVPLVATATRQHVLVANTYSKSVLRVAAGEVSQSRPDVSYFPAYEIVTGPQAPYDFFAADRREPSALAIDAVMRAFLSQCEGGEPLVDDVDPAAVQQTPAAAAARNDDAARQLSKLVSEAQCEEAAAGL
jgi:hypothetical protein